MEETKPKIRFRNYKPYDQSLLPKIESEPNISIVSNTENAADVSKSKSSTIVSDPIQQELQELEAKIGSSELNIVPKKVNWDLKRHCEAKVEKLRKRTQRAIVDLLREKLLEAKDEPETSDEDEG